MFRFLVILCGGLFLTLLIGGRDAGQTRFGLQGAYDIAALRDAPAPARTAQPSAQGAAVVAATIRPAPAVSSARVTASSFGAASGGGSALQTGLTLALPLVSEPAEPSAADPPEAVDPAPLQTARVLGNRVNVREGPSAKSAVLGRLARDETVTVILTDTSGWSMVRIEGDGIEGYIATRYLSDQIDGLALFPAE